MKIFYFLFTFCSWCFAGQSQVLENRIKQFAIENDIEVFWVYNYSCNYDIFLGDCGWEEPHYLFWEQFGKWNIKRFDYCQTFKTIQKSNLGSLDLYLHQFNQIAGANVKPQTDNETKKRSGRRKTSNYIPPSRFTCLYTFNYYFQGQLKKIVEDEYYLKLEKSNNSQKNSNSPAEIKSLILMTENLINEIKRLRR